MKQQRPWLSGHGSSFYRENLREMMPGLPLNNLLYHGALFVAITCGSLSLAADQESHASSPAIIACSAPVGQNTIYFLEPENGSLYLASLDARTRGEVSKAEIDRWGAISKENESKNASRLQEALKAHPFPTEMDQSIQEIIQGVKDYSPGGIVEHPNPLPPLSKSDRAKLLPLVVRLERMKTYAMKSSHDLSAVSPVFTCIGLYTDNNGISLARDFRRLRLIEMFEVLFMRDNHPH